MDVEAVADELYQQDPGSFTAQRDARVAAAREQGDRPAAAAIKAFKRPSPPAWAVNLLARAHPDELDELVDLGARLRQAQASLSGEELRVLSRERHKFIVGLARQTRNLASEQGHPLTATAGRQVEETLNAALADPEAAAAVASGRLVRSLDHAGMGPVDLDGAVARTMTGTAASLAGSRQRTPKARPEPIERGPDASAHARLEAELEEMRAAAASAHEQLRTAQRVAAEAGIALDDASHREAEAESEVRRLEAQLSSARSRAETAKVEAALASRTREEVERSLKAARLRAGEAQERLTAIERRRSSTRK